MSPTAPFLIPGDPVCLPAEAAVRLRRLRELPILPMLKEDETEELVAA